MKSAAGNSKRRYCIAGILIVLVLSILFVLLYYQRCRFISPLRVEVRSESGVLDADASVFGITPAGGLVTFNSQLSGVYENGHRALREIMILSGKDKKNLLIDVYSRDILLWKGNATGSGFGPNRIIYVPPDVRENFSATSFVESLRISGVLKGKLLPTGFLLTAFLLLLFLICRALKKADAFKRWIKIFVHETFPSALSSAWDFLRTNKLRLLMVLVISALPWLLADRLAGISTAYIFNTNVVVSFCLLYVPVFLFVFLFVFNRQTFSNPWFLATVAVTFIYVILIRDPSIHIGGMWYRDTISKYLIKIHELPFPQNIFKPDSGYLAVFAGFFSWVAYSISGGNGSLWLTIIQSVTAAALCITPALFTMKSFRFTGLSDPSRFILAAGTGAFAVFSFNTVLYTEAPYVAGMLSLFLLFMKTWEKNKTTFALLLALNAVLMMSKAYFIAFIPIYGVFFLYCLWKKNRAAALFTGISLLAAIIQLAVVLSSADMMGVASEDGGILHNSFRLRSPGIVELFTGGLFYYLKAYHYLLFQNNISSSGAQLPTNLLSLVLILTVVFHAVRIILRKKNAALGWFIIACNTLSIITCFLFIKTAPDEFILSGDRYIYHYSIVHLLTETVYFAGFQRYTYFIHLPLILSLVPALHSLYSASFRKKGGGLVLTSLVVFISLLFHREPSADIYFWKEIRNKTWVFEWREADHLIHDIHNEYYIPNYNYPNAREVIKWRLDLITDLKAGAASDTFDLEKAGNTGLWNIRVLITPFHPAYGEDTICAALCDASGARVTSTHAMHTEIRKHYLYFVFDKKYKAGKIAIFKKNGESIRLIQPLRIAGTIDGIPPYRHF